MYWATLIFTKREGIQHVSSVKEATEAGNVFDLFQSLLL